MAWLGSSHILSRLVRGAGSFLHRYPTGVAAGVAVLAAGIVAAGCGNQYRPVITPIQPTGPASLPSAYITAVTQPGFSPLGAGVTGPCQGTTYSTPSIYTLLDFSGDSVVAQANGGDGPITFSMEVGGANVYAPNCDGTLTTAQSTTTSLQTKFVLTSTLLPGSMPTNTLLANGSLYVTEVGLHPPTCVTTNCVAQLTGSPDALKQEIPVAPSLINLTGFSTGERIYAISQGNSGGGRGPDVGQLRDAWFGDGEWRGGCDRDHDEHDFGTAAAGDLPGVRFHDAGHAADLHHEPRQRDGDGDQLAAECD